MKKNPRAFASSHAPRQFKRHLLACAVGSLCGGLLPAQAQDSAADSDKSTVVVTGTRVSNRSVADSISPIDVVSSETLNNVGLTEVSESLSTALPALNFPRPGLTDATDTVRPVTLRGLAPDQVLVLVNSKRRHSSALVNVNGSVGRGSASADLNTIPSTAISTVEVLRDGAAAQYGSDAIAGVINFRIRENTSGGGLSINAGRRDTSYGFNPGTPPTGLTLNAPNERHRTDGGTVTVAGWKGFSLGDDGFLTISAELKKQQHSERSGYDVRQFYAKVNGAYDPREYTVNRYDTWYGEPELKQGSVFINAGRTLADGRKVYGWASYQRRESESAGFFRRPIQDENILSIYPDGYLPIIAPTVQDYSAAVGTSWAEGGWDYDLSLVYGKNKLDFDVDNSLNRSIGASSKTSFYAGGFGYQQLTANFSAVRPVTLAALAAPLNVALGAEVRGENYQLWAGEPDSYRYGGEVLASGSPTAAGAQVFPGYTPDNAVDRSRHSVGAFVDLETKLTDKLLASFSTRAEHYSDFGGNVTGKLGARYEVTPAFALRGSVQNGFRAPSPQQQFYTSTSMTFIDGVAFNIATFKPSDAAAIALGAKPLEAEKSVNYSLGAVFHVGPVTLTADAYRIKIDNRIVLSENLTSTAVRSYLQSLGYTGVAGGRFFINGVDTTTDGIDIVANWPLRTQLGRFDLTLAGNYNSTDVTRIPATAQLAALNPAPTLFGRSNIVALESGQPKNKIAATVNWKGARWGATVNATRYGEVIAAGSTAATDFVLTPKTIVNLETRYRPIASTELAIGANNLFDIYPDALPASLNSTGAAPYSNRSPFGRAGRYVYARVNYTF